jgi:transposase-like protein
MNKIRFFNWLDKGSELTGNQRKEAVSKFQENDSSASAIPPAIADAVAENCPHCDCNKLVKDGFASGLQRWKCKDCNRSFNILTKSPLARLRKKEIWLTFAQAMIDGLSVRRAADICDVHYNTTFLWRHRFAEMLGRAQCTELSGIAECDVTLFYRSEKGRTVKNRKPRKRGGHGIPRGNTHHLVPVITLRDRQGKGAERVATKRVALHAADLYHVHLNSDTLLLTDGGLDLCAAVKAVNNAAEDRNSLAHKALIGTANSRGKKGSPYHIQTVNGFHGHLKTWVTRFKGVATKYLENYVGWHRHLMEKHHKDDPNLFIQLAFSPLSVNPKLTVI